MLLAGCKSSGPADPAARVIPSTAPVVKITMTAQKYQFVPEEIVVKQGTHVIIDVTSLNVEHGLRIAEYGIDVPIPAKRSAHVEFYAGKVGTFPFECSKFCGVGHFGMKGRIIVKPAAEE
jgi:heme/copper-type cytochrome/quinol oxidase subunit 2